MMVLPVAASTVPSIVMTAMTMATRVTMAVAMSSHLNHGVIWRRQRRHAEPRRGRIRYGKDCGHDGRRNQCESFHRVSSSGA
jgi:hypothetical protein